MCGLKQVCMRAFWTFVMLVKNKITKYQSPHTCFKTSVTTEAHLVSRVTICSTSKTDLEPV